MKAVQIKEFGGPEVLKTVEVDEPFPNENEVKVKVHAVGLNPNESYTITGTYAYNIPELPYIPGYDATGIIEEIGSNVEGFQIGDRIFLSAFSADRNTGTYAEKVVVDAENVFRLPDNVSLIKGAALGIPAFTAYKALFQKAKIKATLFSGIIWGLWHAPVICMGHNYGKSYPFFPYVGIIIMTIMCITLGTFMAVIF